MGVWFSLRHDVNIVYSAIVVLDATGMHRMGNQTHSISLSSVLYAKVEFCPLDYLLYR